MPKRPMSTLDALARHHEQQQIAREAGEALRRAAALELGSIVLDAGGSTLGVDGVRQAIESAVTVASAGMLAGQSGDTKASDHG